MHVWQLHEAKAKLTQLVNEAKFEPQIISRHGIEETVVMSISMYKQLTEKKEDLVSFFRNSPLMDSDIKIERDKSSIREVNL